MSAARDRVIDAALRLIAERGIGGVTMSAVIEEAGVARQTLYNHFSDVESIVVAVVEEHNAAALSQLTDSLAVAGTATEKLEVLARHAVAMGAHGGVHGFGAGLSAGAIDKVNDHAWRVTELIEEMVQAGQGEGVWRPDFGADAAARFVQGVLGGASNAAAVPKADPPTVIAETMDFLLKGLGQ